MPSQQLQGRLLSVPRSKKVDTLAKQTHGVYREHANNKPERVVSVLHPGVGSIWKCDICKVETSTPTALAKQLRNQHRTCISKYKCVCGFSSDSALSVEMHKRYCQDKEYKCMHCSFSSGTENG